MFFIFPFFSQGYFSPGTFVRALIFLVVAYTIGAISEERAKGEEEIKKARDKSEKILDTVSEAIAIFDRDMNVVDVNGARLKIFDVKREEVIGRKCYEAFQNREEICEGCPVPKIFRTGRVIRKEEIINLPDGTKKYVDVIHTPIFDERREIIQVICDMRDMTALKEAEESLRQTERLAAIGKLSASIAHEIRNPLGVINNAVYYLKMSLPEAGATTKEYLDMISNEVKSAGDIITSLLKLTHTRAAERQEIEVSSVIEKVLEKFDIPETLDL
ncbi:MAG: PAS domain-containing protein [Methanophagales archaeon]|nr:PAS domain-containing protein [Methanophagales archaeon]